MEQISIYSWKQQEPHYYYIYNDFQFSNEPASTKTKARRLETPLFFNEWVLGFAFKPSETVFWSAVRTFLYQFYRTILCSLSNKGFSTVSVTRTKFNS